MSNRQGPVSIYSTANTNLGNSDTRGCFQMVAMLDEDHTRFITGICEITKIAQPPQTSTNPNTNSTTGANGERGSRNDAENVA